MVNAVKDVDAGNPRIIFHMEKRGIDSHQSTTNPRSVLYRKGKGQASRLCCGTYELMENRHGLRAQIAIQNPIAEVEFMMAVKQADVHSERYRGTAPGLARA